MNGPLYSRRGRTALILSPDSFGAALVGVATEFAGFRVAYPAEGESVPDSIRRAKPLVVVVDAEHPILREPASLGPALMTGAAVVFYGRAERLRDVRALASAAHAATITFPDDVEQLAALLTAVTLRNARPSDRRTSE